jgi:hypothetical protein
MVKIALTMPRRVANKKRRGKAPPFRIFVKA